MATFYTDPSITLRGTREPEDFLSRFLQLQQLAEAREDRGLRRREALLRLRELERQAVEGEAARHAMGAGVRPGLQVPQGREGRLGVDIPASFDRQTALQALAQGEAAHLVPGVQAQFIEQDAAQQEQRAKAAQAIATMNKTQLDTMETALKIRSRAASDVITAPEQIRPQIYAAWRERLIESGLMDEREAPPQYSPELVPLLQSTAQGSPEYGQMMQERRAQLEFEAKQKAGTLGGRERLLTPEEEAQKIRIGKATRQEATAIVQTVDEQGRPVTRIVPKRAGSEFAARPTAAQSGVSQAQERARPVVEQIEQLSKQINLGSGVAAVVTGRARSAMGAANYDTAVAQYEALISGAIPLVARALGHTGVLTEQDVQSTRALFPLPGDSKELAESKLRVVRSIMQGQGGTQPQAGRVEVKTPGGSFFFATQAEADAFKKEAGIP